MSASPSPRNDAVDVTVDIVEHPAGLVLSPAAARALMRLLEGARDRLRLIDEQTQQEATAA